MAKIKWPNDILLNDKKICGILTEMDGEMDCVRSIVVGIGINVNDMRFPKELAQKATSLKKESGIKEDILRIPLLAAVLFEFEQIYEQFRQDCDFMPFLSEYLELCSTIEQEVQVVGKNPFYGRAVRITPKGGLVLQKEDGEEVVIYSGEVSIRPARQSSKK